VEQLTEAGGNATFLSLPDDLGIHGNSHMLMMDNNNLDLADILINWIHQNVQ
jgi:hypothetical protein